MIGAPPARAGAAARCALDDRDVRYAQEHRRLEAEPEKARAAAEPMRTGLLYGTGAEPEHVRVPERQRQACPDVG